MTDKNYNELMEEIDKLYLQSDYKEQKYILISEDEYNKLQERLEKLDKLESGGVDNWQGYDYAMSQDDED